MPDRGTVLVVDDDPDVRELWEILFSNAGFDVRTAQDGEAGLRMAAEYHPDLVLTDLAMPRLDGLEMARQLRQRAETRNVPIIAVSGQLVGDTTQRAYAAGCTDVLGKPCYLDTLIDTVNRYIGGRRNPITTPFLSAR